MKIKIINFDTKGNEQGWLISLEQNRNIPFDIKRVYYIFGTKSEIRRGFHAHKDLKQVLICVKGSCTILLDDGIEKAEVKLDSPDKGLMVNKMIWHEMFNFSDDCVLLVLADDYYDEADYIRNYEEFMRFFIQQ